MTGATEQVLREETSELHRTWIERQTTELRPMGFYIRKAIKVGPLRFNLSKSGVGVSAGIKGLRLGAGPRGNYVHMGRGGLYFRQTLGPASVSPQRRVPLPTPIDSNSVGEFQEIESASVSHMVDGSSFDLLTELNEKRGMLRLFPFTAIIGGVTVVSLIAASSANWIVLTSLVAVGAICWLAATRDALKKTTVVMYDLESDANAAYEGLHEAFRDLRECGRVWHVEAKAGVRDAKYHAGAGSLIKRRIVSVTVGQPPLVKSNVEVPLIPAGRQVLAFMPDRLLVFERSAVGAVAYSDLVVDRSETRFVEEESVPSDATVVDKTWRYVNKRGGPDKRFKDNREIPVCAYSQLRFSSASGLNEVFQMSRRATGEPQVAALAVLGRLPTGQPSQPSNPAMEPTART